MMTESRNCENCAHHQLCKWCRDLSMPVGDLAFAPGTPITNGLECERDVVSTLARWCGRFQEKAEEINP